MGISDKIEAFIIELLKEEASDEGLELKRNELASVFGCVPSQINYVISTRFNPERGYTVESRRGGGGYVRIKRISEAESPVGRVIREIGERIDYPTAQAYVSYLISTETIDEKTAALILSAVSDNSLSVKQPERGRLRAVILKNMLAAI